ncbi:MAG: hypothetical protein J6Z49_10865 [Kiritimatiellae bacterium]|nr:hypothetical protein [Kiritimatiellia bacterium]
MRSFRRSNWGCRVLGLAHGFGDQGVEVLRRVKEVVHEKVVVCVLPVHVRVEAVAYDGGYPGRVIAAKERPQFLDAPVPRRERHVPEYESEPR